MLLNGNTLAEDVKWPHDVKCRGTIRLYSLETSKKKTYVIYAIT